MLVVVQLLSCVWLFGTPWTAAHQESLSFTIFLRFHKLMSISRWSYPTTSSSVTPFSSCPHSFPALRSFPMSQLFTAGTQSVGASISASSLPVNIQDWFHLPAVQRTLKSLLQHHSLKPSILQHSALFMVQVSRLYMTTGKTIALTIQTFVSKVMTLIFNVLSRFVMSFLPRSKCLSVYGCSQHPQWFWSPGK